MDPIFYGDLYLGDPKLGYALPIFMQWIQFSMAIFELE